VALFQEHRHDAFATVYENWKADYRCSLTQEDPFPLKPLKMVLDTFDTVAGAFSIIVLQAEKPGRWFLGCQRGVKNELSE
jgi:hypothetical protein